MDTATTVETSDAKSPMVIALGFTCAAHERGDLVRGWAMRVMNDARMAGLDPSSPDFILLSCSLESCGGHAMYRMAEDIPLVDVPCPCGDPNHWLIKWIEPEQEE